MTRDAGRRREDDELFVVCFFLLFSFSFFSRLDARSCLCFRLFLLSHPTTLSPPLSPPSPTPSQTKNSQEDKVAKAVHNNESVVKEIDVRLSVAGGDAGKGPRAQRAEVTIFTHRYGVVRVEDCEESAYAAVDVVCDKVRSKLRRVKEKAIARGRWPGSARPRGAEKVADAAAEAAAAAGGFSSDSDSEELASISSAASAYAGAAAAPEELIREKTFSLTPMSAAEAAEQLDLLGHDFYVFADSAGGGVRVVYKRREKGYGVIVPKLPPR